MHWCENQKRMRTVILVCEGAHIAWALPPAPREETENSLLMSLEGSKKFILLLHV